MELNEAKIKQSKSVLALRIQVDTHLSHIIAPSSQIGPEPLQIPVSGYSMVVDMVCYGNIDLLILGFRAEVIQRSSLQSDSIMMGCGDPLAIPHFEVLLDKVPPLIQPALKAGGSPARPTPQLPFILHPAEYRRLFLAPVTHSPDLIWWSLYTIWEFQGKRQESLYGVFQVTGDTGWRHFEPNGQSRPCHVQEAAPDHWDIDVPRNKTLMNGCFSIFRYIYTKIRSCLALIGLKTVCEWIRSLIDFDDKRNAQAREP